MGWLMYFGTFKIKLWKPLPVVCVPAIHFAQAAAFYPGDTVGVSDRSRLLKLLMGWGPPRGLGQNMPGIDFGGLSVPLQHHLWYLQNMSLLFKLLEQEGMGRLSLGPLSPADGSAEGPGLAWRGALYLGDQVRAVIRCAPLVLHPAELLSLV